MLNTINFAKSLKPDRIIFSIVTQYPGTELYEYCLQAFPGKIPKIQPGKNFFINQEKLYYPRCQKKIFMKL